ncbi:hypothetical protein WJR50_27050 [Catalinimonas sp. 4WD22]|uniref:hypothetical protein n=1 Tax=Catalinimonas locisalis TaxID=3133978 RepID=UPI00310101A9
MAQVKNNIITDGLSGSIGRQIVFRQLGGKTIVSAMPNMPEERSEAQKKQSARFREAVKYAQHVLDDPALLATYAVKTQSNKSPYCQAIADYLNLPVIVAVKLDAFEKKAGNRLWIQATDDHLITKVHCLFCEADGSLLEQGLADLDEYENEWVYTLKYTHTHHQELRLVVRITDLPGNSIVREELIR